jgi:CRP/FNR family transcriptional regulator, anaerobic regulatory protein
MSCCFDANGTQAERLIAEEAFRGCSSGACARLGGDTSVLRKRQLRRGERLDIGDKLKLWTVHEGAVALCSSLADGRRQIVCFATPSDLLCPPKEYYSLELWVEALAPSWICELDLTARAQTIADDATLSAELFQVVQNQVNCIYTHLVTLGRLDGMERVCLFLADMAWRIGEVTPEGWHVRLPLARDDIADYLGLNAETISRIFGRVKKARLADFHSPTEYVVRDIGALQQRAPIAAPHSPAAPLNGGLGEAL